MQSKLSRGFISFKLSCSSNHQNTNLIFDEQKLDSFIKKSLEIQSKYPQVGKITMGDILSLRDLQADDFLQFDKEKLEKEILQLSSKIIEQLIAMQLKEGKEIIKDILIRSKTLFHYTQEIKAKSTDSMTKHRERLMKKVAEINSNLEINDSILEREILFYLDREDITEELVRLEVHLNRFQELLEENQDNGRELEFLIQEIGREINTTGAKSQGTIIGNYVVKFKTELEKCREQIQNLA